MAIDFIKNPVNEISKRSTIDFFKPKLTNDEVLKKLELDLEKDRAVFEAEKSESKSVFDGMSVETVSAMVPKFKLKKLS